MSDEGQHGLSGGLSGEGRENVNLDSESRNESELLTTNALNKILLMLSKNDRNIGDLAGFPSFDPDHSRVDINRWCTDIDSRVERDSLKDYDIIPRVRASLLGRAKVWFEKYGYQHYSWSDLRSSMVHAFSSGTDIISQLRQVANSESSEFCTYTDFVMEKVSQVNRLSFEIPEDKIVRIVIGCIADVSLRNSLTFVMPSSVQSLIDHLSSIREPPGRRREPFRRYYPTRTVKGEGPAIPQKRPRIENEKRCFDCGKLGHLRASCPRNRPSTSGIQTVREMSNSKINNNKSCVFCGKLGHDENTCWAKQRAELKKVNLCDKTATFDSTTVVVINGKIHRCLLDTGSDCSLIRADIADKILARRNTHFLSVQGIGKEPVLLTQKTDLVVEFKDISIEVTFHIINDAYLRNEMIIGRDVLNDSSLEILVDKYGSTLRRKKIDNCSMNLVKTSAYPVILSKYRQELKPLLEKYSKHIVKGFPMAKVTTGSLQIRLAHDVIINYRPYRMALSERRVVTEIINDLKAHEIIRDSSSSFASPIILVKKKNGKDRLCVDYRALNRATIKDRYPLPRIDDQLDRLSGNKYFTSLDMASGFHQIPITHDSIEKTAFVTPDGHYEYLRMPFGLANAPAVFQRAINNALGDLKDTIALVYLDDVLIPSKSAEEGIEKLDIVLKALTESGFSLNIDKCQFLQTQIEYLGREVSAEGIRPGKSKIDALVRSPTPINVKQVRQFMGLSNYFRKFIPEFAAKTGCITALTKINTKFEWTKECEEARQYIIKQLTKRPVLVIFDPERPTELHTDASSVGYGAVLFQRIDNQLHVVAYYSQATKAYEANYHSYELETLAVINSVKHFRSYLLGIEFTLVTDCNALKATKEKKDLLPRIARWWIYLQDFNFKIHYRKGKTMQHADYLSRNPTVKSCYQLNSLSENWLHIGQSLDTDTAEIMEKLREGDANTKEQYVIQNGLLYRKLQEGNKLFVPQRCRLALMRRYHEDNCHVGWEKTLAKMREHFWMPSMTRNVRKFVESCLICLVAKRPSGKKQCELHPIEKKSIPFHTIHVDCTGPFYGKNKGDNRHILIIVDAFTKFVVLLPCKTLQAAETVQHLINFVMLFGIPCRIISDKGTNFTSENFRNLCKTYGIEHHTIAPGISRANGQVERYVDTVTNLLRTNLGVNMEWTNYVNRVQLALNTTVNKTTGLSPMKILTGVNGRTPEINALLSELNIEPEYEDIDAIRALTDERIRENAGRMKTRFDIGKCKPTRLEIGTKVVYKSNQIRKSKLDVHYRGPYEVIGILPNNRYKLKRGQHSKVVIVAARESIRPIIDGDNEEEKQI